MRTRTILLMIVAAVFMLVSNATAAEDIIETVAKGCEKELTSYCSEVTPGEGRILACLYAHEDKLNGQCEFALYDAAAQLERFVSGLSYLANECHDDLVNHCQNVEIGEGRLATCLLDNKDKLQSRCATAIDLVDLEVTE